MIFSQINFRAMKSAHVSNLPLGWILAVAVAAYLHTYRRQVYNWVGREGMRWISRLMTKVHYIVKKCGSCSKEGLNHSL